MGKGRAQVVNRRIPSGLAATVVATILVGCGSSGSVQPVEADAGQDSPSTEMDAGRGRICDGTPATRLAIRAIGGGRIAPGSLVLQENGSAVLLVSGQCQFATYTEVWSGVRTGTLTQAQEQELFALLNLDKWPEWAGSWQVNGCDISRMDYRLGTTDIMLKPACGAVRTPPPFETKDLNLAALGAMEKLWNVGTPPAGDGRAILVRHDPADLGSYPNVAWPVALDPESFALSIADADAIDPGDSRLFPVGDAALLRTVRDDYRTGKYGMWTGGELTVTGSSGAKYALFFRDVFPGEDARGLIHDFD